MKKNKINDTLFRNSFVNIILYSFFLKISTIKILRKKNCKQ